MRKISLGAIIVVAFSLFLWFNSSSKTNGINVVENQILLQQARAGQLIISSDGVMEILESAKPDGLMLVKDMTGKINEIDVKIFALRKFHIMDKYK